MISVPSPRLLLSGSKFFTLFLLFIVFSCSPSKRAVKKDDVQVVKSGEDGKPKDKNDVPSTTKVDTLQWRKDNNLPPITEKKGDEIGMEEDLMKESYIVSMFIPFKARDHDQDDDRFSQYYAGIKLGAAQLENEGISLTINAFDSDESKTPVSLVPEETDIIVGPYEEAGLKAMIEYGKEKQIPVISPWYSLSKVEQNPYYVQLRPTLKDHFNAMVNHISKNFKASEVVLVGRNNKNDQAWFKFFQVAGQKYYNTQAPKIFVEHFVLDDSLALGQWVFGDLLDKGKKVFIIPNHSFKDESYIYSVLRRLNAEKHGQKIVVYGMPIMIDSDRIDFDYYNSLNMRVVVSEFVDDKDSKVASFGRKFFDEYGTLPENDAFEAYDMILFIGRNLKNHGRKFQFRFQKDSEEYLQTSFDIMPFKKEDSDTIEFYENKHLSIIGFSQGRFKKID